MITIIIVSCILGVNPGNHFVLCYLFVAAYSYLYLFQPVSVLEHLAGENKKITVMQKAYFVKNNAD